MPIQKGPANLGTGVIDATELASASVTPAKLSTGGPSWDTSGNNTLSGNLVAGNSLANKLSVNGNTTGQPAYITSSGTDTNVGIDLNTKGAGAIRMNPGGSVVVQVDSSGLVTLPYGQVKFPATQNPSSNANTLDDYEEGTWTPTLTASSGSATYNFQYGVYTKIGRLVTVNFWIYGSGRSTLSGTVTITGLPFACSATEVRPSAMFRTNSVTITGILGGWFSAGASSINLDANSNGGATGLSATSLSTGTFEIGGFITYVVD